MAVDPNDKIVRGADLTVVGQQIKNALNSLPVYKTTDSHSANQVLAAPKDNSGTASFRALEPEDIPALHYHPYGGDENIDLEADDITSASVAARGSINAGNTMSAGSNITVGSGHTGAASTEDSYRVVNFGSLNQYIKLKNVGTPENPSWAFEFSAPFYDITSGTISPGSPEVPSIPHVLIEKTAFEQLSNPDNGTIYLIYEEE